MGKLKAGCMDHIFRLVSSDGKSVRCERNFRSGHAQFPDQVYTTLSGGLLSKSPKRKPTMCESDLASAKPSNVPNDQPYYLLHVPHLTDRGSFSSSDSSSAFSTESGSTFSSDSASICSTESHLGLRLGLRRSDICSCFYGVVDSPSPRSACRCPRSSWNLCTPIVPSSVALHFRTCFKRRALRSSQYESTREESVLQQMIKGAETQWRRAQKKKSSPMLWIPNLHSIAEDEWPDAADQTSRMCVPRNLKPYVQFLQKKKKSYLCGSPNRKDGAHLQEIIPCKPGFKLKRNCDSKFVLAMEKKKDRRSLLQAMTGTKVVPQTMTPRVSSVEESTCKESFHQTKLRQSLSFKLTISKSTESKS